LLGDVVAACAIGVVPEAGKGFPQDGIQGLFDACGLDVPAGQVELGDGDETLDRVVDSGKGQEGVGVCHEIRDSFEHAAGFQNEGREGDTRELGAWSQLADDVGKDVALLGGHDGLVLVGDVAVHAAARRSSVRLLTDVT
jgi:hypothetical protein